MTTKALIVIVAVASIVAIANDSVILAWIPTLLIGLFILVNSRNNSENRFVGILSVKPLLIFAFWGWLRLRSSLDGISAYLVFIPDLILTLILVYSFRDLLKDELLFVFFIGDLVRWLILAIELLIPDPYPDTFSVLQNYIFIFFFLIFPSLYAVYGLMELRSTRKRIVVA